MTTNELAAAESVRKIQESGSDTEVRVCRRVEIGHCAAHQGDVYVFRVSDAHPRGAALGTRQVAVGTTVGSRHIVEGEGVTVYAGEALPSQVRPRAPFVAKDYLGPVVVAKEPFVLTHPEHAHHELPAGTYQVTYQVDESTMRRVED